MLMRGCSIEVEGEPRERVNDIAAALMACGTHAVAHGDQAWLERHAWFGEAIERLFVDQRAVPLDG